MRPGEVPSDQQALQQILGRLDGEVGTLIRVVIESEQRGHFPDTAFFWSLIEGPPMLGQKTLPALGQESSAVLKEITDELAH